MCRGEKEPKDIGDRAIDRAEQADIVRTAKENTQIAIQESYRETEKVADKMRNRTATDQDFRSVLSLWGKSESHIRNLEQEFHRLIRQNDNLFLDLDGQIQMTRDPVTKERLEDALDRVFEENEVIFRDTKFAIDNLWELHAEAESSVNAMRVAHTLGELSDLNVGLKNLKRKIEIVMSDLNDAIRTSKTLFENDMIPFEQ